LKKELTANRTGFHSFKISVNTDFPRSGNIRLDIFNFRFDCLNRIISQQKTQQRIFRFGNFNARALFGYFSTNACKISGFRAVAATLKPCAEFLQPIRVRNPSSFP